MHCAPRCRARSKRSGKTCRAPAVRGWRVCRMHGANGGAPRGERNGAYRHGGYTIESIRRRRQVRDLLTAARDLVEATGSRSR